MKKILFIFIVSFILNFLWEISQAFLYAPHFVGIAGLITVHLRAGLGDVLMVFIILALDTLILNRIFVGEKTAVKRYLVIMLIGFVLATLVEKYALATGRWSYASLMPIIPFLNVGLTPILQMIVIPSVIIIAWSGLTLHSKTDSSQK